MKNYLKTLLGATTILAFTVSSAYSGMGVSLMYGQVETDGTETERTVSGVTSEKKALLNLKITSVVLFSQKLNYAGLTLGLDVVPFKIKLR